MGKQYRWRFQELGTSSLSLPDPPGFAAQGTIVDAEISGTSLQAVKQKNELLAKRALDMGLAPGKNIFMQGFMMWMSGSSINIFSIMITGMAFMNPIKAIVNVEDAFKRFKGTQVDLTLPKLAFIACNLGMVALALWKCNTMGLLPITAADWTSFLVDKSVVEASTSPIVTIS
mmetsp:Transcript_21612/g.69607  ORF Transcript_21612/g.69607 Transcript_21612/m.69607 type:complete len:173 (-) Transcript_21612:54-572(-)